MADGNGDLTRRSVFQLTGLAFALPAFQSNYLESGPMPFTPKFVDLVRNVTSVTGTGPVTLGQAVSGFSSLAAAVATGDQFYYCIQGVDKPAEREVGRGTMQADGKVARQVIAGSLTNFTSGIKTIALVTPAEWFARLDGAMASAASRAELAGKDGIATPRAYLAEADRAGTFLFDNSDQSAKVSADAAQGIYVSPVSDSTGASGAWVRKIEGPINPAWFGVRPGIGHGAANSAALAAMFGILQLRAANSIYDAYRAIEAIRFPPGYFEFNETIDLTGGSFDFRGATLVKARAGATILRFPAGKTGIRVQAFNTSGAAGDAALHYGANGTVIKGFELIGAYSSTEAEAHGIHLRGVGTIENVHVRNFEGDGFYSSVDATAASNPRGNTNLARMAYCSAEECRNGLYVDGPDANAWTIIGFDARDCRQWGVWDSSFLGNTHIGGHCAGCGTKPGVPPNTVHHGGHRYYVKSGQEAGAATNAPSGTTADNDWWGYLNSVGSPDPSINVPTWSSGVIVRTGGAYHSDSVSGRNVFVGCYAEEGGAPSQFGMATVVIGGLLGSGVKGTGVWLRNNAGKAEVDYLQTTNNLTVKGVDNCVGRQDATSSNLYLDGTALWFREYNSGGTLLANNGLIFASLATGGMVINGQTKLILRHAGTDIAETSAAGWNLPAGKVYQIAGTKVVGPRKTGWATATGTATRTSFDTATVTLPQLAERVKALIDDLHAAAGHGLIGT